MKTLLLFQNFGIWEVLIIALVVLLLFGGKKIPELMKGLGKGVKSFKEGMAETEKDLNEIKKEIERPAEPVHTGDKSSSGNKPEEKA